MSSRRLMPLTCCRLALVIWKPISAPQSLCPRSPFPTPFHLQGKQLDISPSSWSSKPPFHSETGYSCPNEMAAYWTSWTEKYPVVSLEDGMAEDDWAGWKTLSQSVGTKSSKKKIQLV